MNVARHDTDLALTRLNNARAVRADQSCFVLRPHNGLDLDHIKSGDTLSNADNEVHLGLDSLEDGISSEGRRHIDDGCISVSGLLSLGDGAKDR